MTLPEALAAAPITVANRRWAIARKGSITYLVSLDADGRHRIYGKDPAVAQGDVPPDLSWAPITAADVPRLLERGGRWE